MPAMNNAYGTFKGQNAENPESRQGVHSSENGDIAQPLRLSELIPRTPGHREISIVIKTSSLVWGIIKLVELFVLVTCLACLGTFVGQFDHEEQMRLLGGTDLIFTLLAGLIVFNLLVVYLTFSGASNIFSLKRWLCMIMLSHVVALFFSFMISVLLSRDAAFYHSVAHNNGGIKESLCKKVAHNTDGINCSYLDAVMALSWVVCLFLLFDVLSYCIAFNASSNGH